MIQKTWMPALRYLAGGGIDGVNVCGVAQDVLLEIERLEAVRNAAIKVVAQTTADAAYQRHDDLIAALEALDRR